MLQTTPRKLCGRGACFSARSWRGPGEFKILKENNTWLKQTDPRNVSETFTKTYAELDSARARWVAAPRT